MKFTIDEIISAVNGEIIFNKCNFGKTGISTDSRTIKDDEIFLPLSGENFDGHDFINNALKQRAVGYFIDKKHIDKVNRYYNPTRVVIAVEDTLLAYLQLANYVRDKVNPKVIAVTGSSGKTTVKEMIWAIFSGNYETYKSALNHNNEVGLCQTLTNIPENTEVLIVEMGMRGLGEIELLSKYAEPDFAVITNVGNAHIGKLGSLDNIAKAKCEIIKHLKKDGTLIAFDDELIKKHCRRKINKIFYGKNYKILKLNENSVEFEYEGNKYKIPVGGEHNVINALSVIEIGKLAGLSQKKIAEGLLKYQPIGERGKIVNIGKNIKIISDCYNANPESMKAAINAVFSTYPDSKITLVLGDMAELGEQENALHADIGNFLNGKDFYQLVTVGEKAKLIANSVKNKKTYSNNQDAIDFLRNNLPQNSVVLLKGSRCMKLEEITEALSGELSKC